MDITCPNCKIRRTIEDSKLPAGQSKVTTLCKSCGHRFTLFLEGEKRATTESVPNQDRPAPEVAAKQQSQAKQAPAPAKKAAPKEPAQPKAKAAPKPAAPRPAAQKTAAQKPKRPMGMPAKQETRSLGVILSKGGVGKTTTSVNLSAGLALAGYKVLLVDADTQGQSSYMLGVKPEAGLAELVSKEVEPQEAIFKARENLWILAGGRQLAGVKRLIDRKDFGGELTLSEALTPFEHLFDFVIVDSSPGWDPITVNVLFYVKELLIPVSLEVMSLQGLSEFSKSLATIQKYRQQLGITYIVPTFSDEKIESREEILVRLRDLYGDYLCTPIRYCADLSEAPAYGRSVFEYAPDSIGTLDYKALIRRVTDGDALF